MNVGFSNLGFFASIFQSFANSAGNMVRWWCENGFYKFKLIKSSLTFFRVLVAFWKRQTVHTKGCKGKDKKRNGW